MTHTYNPNNKLSAFFSFFPKRAYLLMSKSLLILHYFSSSCSPQTTRIISHAKVLKNLASAALPWLKKERHCSPAYTNNIGRKFPIFSLHTSFSRSNNGHQVRIFPSSILRRCLFLPIKKSCNCASLSKDIYPVEHIPYICCILRKAVTLKN